MRKIRILAAMSMDGFYIPLKESQRLCNFDVSEYAEFCREADAVLTTVTEYKKMREIELTHGKPVYMIKEDTSLALEKETTGNNPLTIEELQKSGKENILITGNCRNLISSLLNKNRVDEINTILFPVILGRGKRIFSTLPLSLWKVKSRQLSDLGITAIQYNKK